MIRANTNSSSHAERGIALMAAILTLMLITAIAAGMILLTNSDTQISGNFRDEQTAYFAAKAGMEEVRDRMLTGATNTISASLPTAVPGQSNGILYILNPINSETDTPWATGGSYYPDDEICTEVGRIGTSCSGTLSSTWYTTANASSSYAATPTLPWKWTRVTLKTNLTTSSSNPVDNNASDTNNIVCWTGINQTTTSYSNCTTLSPSDQPVYVLTSLAVTPSGSRRMVQAEAAKQTFPTVPGPMVFDGNGASWSDPNSNRFGVSGSDQAKGPNNGAGCPAGQNEYALGATSAGDVSNMTSAHNMKRPNSYTGLGGSPSVGDVSSQLGPLATVTGLNQLVDEVISAASPVNIYSGGQTSITNMGNDANPVINVVKGDLSLSGSGAGILLVEGTLTLNGNFSYDGLILVIGKGSLVKNGGGGATTNGSILVANLYDSSGNLITSGPPGSPSISWNGGGNSNINYDSCWSSQFGQNLPYKIQAVREMMY